jgi:hypothetical protein
MHHTGKDKHKPKVKGWKKISQPNGAQKQTEVVILISDKADFKQKLERVKRELHIDKGNNPSKGYKNCNHIHQILAHSIS